MIEQRSFWWIEVESNLSSGVREGKFKEGDGEGDIGKSNDIGN
jgi:hypothetical protein